MSNKAKFSETFELERNKITIRPDLFQGRTHAYATETVDKIVREGFDKSQYPIIVWFDHNTGKYIVISGHSRWEASKILFNKGNTNLKTMPVKEFQGDLDEAVEYAVLESNRSGTDEGMKSDLKAYKLALKKGYNKEKLLGIFKPESKLKLLQDFAYLNENGLFLENMGEESEKSFPYLQRNAQWVGKMRKEYKQLSNAHEKELFEYLYKNSKTIKINKDSFFDLVNKKVSRFDFKPEQALNLSNVVSSSSYTDPIKEQVKELDKVIAEFRKEIESKQNLIVKAKEVNPSLVDKFKERIKELNKIILLKLEQKIKLESSIRHLEANVVDMFSQEEPVTNNNNSTRLRIVKAKAIAKIKLLALSEHTLTGAGKMIRKLFLNKKNNTLDGWKEDKEKFKIELVNDIKDFLFAKWEKPWIPSLVFDSNGNVINSYKNISGRYYHNQSNIMGLKVNSGVSPFFITLSKLEELEGTITDRNKITSIVSYVPMYKDKGNVPVGSKKQADWMMPLYHSVICVDYVEGIKKPAITITKFKNLELNQYVENFIAALQKHNRIPKLIYDQSDSCYYSHSHGFTTDEIHLVNINTFKSIEKYYSVLFHEITHSTKATSRLGVRNKKDSVNLEYANEELVAEMGAMIVCAELGLMYNRQNSISYLKGWLDNAMKKGGNIDEILLEAYAYACDTSEYLLNDIDLQSLVPETMQERALEEAETIEKEYIELFKNDKCKVINHLLDKRVKVFFNIRPENLVIEHLKKEGFRWAMTAKAWQKLNTTENIEIALKVVGSRGAEKNITANRIRIAKVKAIAKLKLLEIQ